MSNQLFVGTRKGLFELKRSAKSWQIQRTWFLGDNVPMLLPDSRDGSLYVAINHGHFGNKLHRLDSGADKWTEITAPAYPPRPEGLPKVLNSMGSPEPDWKLQLVWILETAGPDRAGSLWAGTVPGGLFFSPDRGATWELNRPLWDDPSRPHWVGGGMDQPGVHSVCVDPRDSNRVSLGISSAGVWQTNDNGKSWSCDGKGMRAEYMPPEMQFDPKVQDPHRLVQSPTNPDVFWVQHHNGIFHSTDCAKNWQEISSPPVPASVFGFAVAVHPRDAGTAWFVPGIKDEKRIPVAGKLIVSRTHDGGKSFQALTGGLPQEHAYDLVFRHCLDVDQTGDTLAFGSTTGSLFTTDDGGDQWTRLPHQLPPVYCVRFGN